MWFRFYPVSGGLLQHILGTIDWALRESVRFKAYIFDMWTLVLSRACAPFKALIVEHKYNARARMRELRVIS